MKSIFLVNLIIIIIIIRANFFDFWQSIIIEMFEKYKFWSQVKEYFETLQILKILSLRERYCQRKKLSEGDLF